MPKSRDSKMSSAASANGVAAVDRALTILKAVADAKEPVSLATLARRTGFYKSTLLRLLGSLNKAALVRRNGTGSYILGPYARELGRHYESTYHVDQVILPLLADLIDAGTESASFHVHLDDYHRICVLRLNSRHSTLDHIDEGDLLPLAKGAAGKLISAFHGTGLQPSLSNVIAVSLGEREHNCAAVACAVFMHDNEFCGAMSLSGPKERFNQDTIQHMRTLLLAKACQASESLGGQWPTK